MSAARLAAATTAAARPSRCQPQGESSRASAGSGPACMRGSTGSGTNPALSQATASWRRTAGSHARWTKAAEACAAAQTGLDQRREAWVVARRDLRVIENLEVKARQVYRHELEYEEQKLLDDRTNATAGRAPLLMS